MLIRNATIAKQRAREAKEAKTLEFADEVARAVDGKESILDFDDGELLLVRKFIECMNNAIDNGETEYFDFRIGKLEEAQVSKRQTKLASIIHRLGFHISYSCSNNFSNEVWAVYYEEQ